MILSRSDHADAKLPAKPASSNYRKILEKLSPRDRARLARAVEDLA